MADNEQIIHMKKLMAERAEKKKAREQHLSRKLRYIYLVSQLNGPRAKLALPSIRRADCKLCKAGQTKSLR
jgi:hypothetical protein